MWPEAPEELAAAIDRSLLRDVSARWGTMRELMDAVREALDR